MNDFSISITATGTKKYPLHQHKNWEIMYYLSGVGHLATENNDYPFSPGSIIIVPPKTVHGSVSQDGFVNISISGDFNHLFMFEKILTLHDNAALDGERLVRLIFENRHTDIRYLTALCNAYAHFLLQNAGCEKRIHQVIHKIIEQTTQNFFDPNFEITALLHQSGYAEDYIRAKFKKVTAHSPIDFLTKIRIDHARKLFEIYGQTLSVAEVAEACGFDDTVYFSKRFKQFTGWSPTEYRKNCLNEIDSVVRPSKKPPFSSA